MAMMHPGWDPVVWQWGPLVIRWYGLLYGIAFAAIYGGTLIPVWRRTGKWGPHPLGDLLIAGMYGVLIGGRLGFVAIYQGADWWHDPGLIFRIWEGGMSFHGGLLGVVGACIWYARRTGGSWIQITDQVAPWVPLGLGLGRLANFINGELWGRVTDVPWGMVFPVAGPEPRHPSQLYEMALEGLVLGAILWACQRRNPVRGTCSAVFLLGYGTMRMGVECFREPDRGMAWVGPYWTMGQYLSLPMVIIGGIWLVYLMRQTSRARTAHPS